MENLKRDASILIQAFLSKAPMHAGNILLVGCSTSEAQGKNFGEHSSLEIAEKIFQGIYPIVQSSSINLAVQCCEHLNRAIVVEKDVAIASHSEIVDAVPYIDAGGAFATGAYKHFRKPVLVEYMKCDAGIDIGNVLIGMNLKHVAVPVRLGISTIGKASVVCARTRPKYIGGKRARHNPE